MYSVLVYLKYPGIQPSQACNPLAVGGVPEKALPTPSHQYNLAFLSLIRNHQQLKMSWLFHILVSPTILIVSIPLTVFAAFTTTLAFSTLLFRVLIIYAELAAALIQDQFAFAGQNTTSTSRPHPSSLKPITKDRHSHRERRRSSAASGSSNGGSTTPKAPETSGFGIYSGGVAARDFEGVGGWRIPGPDDDDQMWENMNSRLELPALVNDGRPRNHHRSRTSGSLTSVQVPMRSPVQSRARTPTSTRVPDITSPEEYFASRAPSKSTPELDAANIGKALLRRKPSSSSSGSSQGSSRTLHLTLSNT